MIGTICELASRSRIVVENVGSRSWRESVPHLVDPDDPLAVRFLGLRHG